MVRPGAAYSSGRRLVLTAPVHAMVRSTAPIDGDPHICAATAWAYHRQDLAFVKWVLG
jgi:hypothetical protein